MNSNSNLNKIHTNTELNINKSELKKLWIPLFLFNLLIKNKIIENYEDLEIFKSLDFSSIDKNLPRSHQLRLICESWLIQFNSWECRKNSNITNYKFIFLNKIQNFLNNLTTDEIIRITWNNISLIFELWK